MIVTNLFFGVKYNAEFVAFRLNREISSESVRTPATHFVLGFVLKLLRGTKAMNDHQGRKCDCL